MTRRRLLVLCTGNSCRSQIAEGWVRARRGDRWEVASAGTRPAAAVHPLAVRVMAEAGVDLAGARPKTIDEVGTTGWDLVVTVCDAAHETCPVLPGARQLHVSFPDPALVAGSEDERLTVFRRVRDRIRDELLPRLDGATEA